MPQTMPHTMPEPQTMTSGKNLRNQKILPNQISEIRCLYHSGFSQTQIARKFEVSQGSISRLLKVAKTLPGEQKPKVGKNIKSLAEYKKSNIGKQSFMPKIQGDNNGLQNTGLMSQTMWTEKYRAKTLDDLVISPKIRRIGEKILKTGKLQNLLLHGSYGIGKTSFAEVIIKTLGLQTRSLISRKQENLREVYKLSTITTVMGANYVALIDECDALRMPVQKEMLRFLEGYETSIQSSILICNDISAIHKGVQSRCKELSFDWSNKELDSNLKQLKNRLVFILESEKIQYSLGDLDDYIENYFLEDMDIRKIIHELEGSVTEDGELLPL